MERNASVLSLCGVGAKTIRDFFASLRMTVRRPDILFIMTDQQRFDTIAALGNSHIYTPNMDRLVRRGITFSNAYATCPVCVAARYTIRTGCEPATTRVFSNAKADPVDGQALEMEARCGPYLARTMSRLGYRTFGIGKFHTNPWNEDLGYETLWRCEETYHPPDREGDDYGSWLAREHPEFDFLEQPMGERTEMYYLPQRSPLPADLGGEWWTADRTIEEIAKSDDPRPFFGFVSFVGPHPPLAPPIPFNRMYNPDRMPEPVLGKIEEDHLDEEIPFMRHAIWADAINPALAKIVKARYYGEITYLDYCLGRILDAIEARANSDNVLICFFSDHGDLLGDHHGWQKQNFFEAACRVPLLLSWPTTLPAGTVRTELISLADLFGIATEPRAHANCAKESTFSKCFEANARRASISSGWLKFPARMISKSWSLPTSGNTFSWPTAAGNNSSIANAIPMSCRTASARVRNQRRPLCSGCESVSGSGRNRRARRRQPSRISFP